MQPTGPLCCARRADPSVRAFVLPAHRVRQEVRSKNPAGTRRLLRRDEPPALYGLGDRDSFRRGQREEREAEAVALEAEARQRIRARVGAPASGAAGATPASGAPSCGGPASNAPASLNPASRGTPASLTRPASARPASARPASGTPASRRLGPDRAAAPASRGLVPRSTSASAIDRRSASTRAARADSSSKSTSNSACGSISDGSRPASSASSESISACSASRSVGGRRRPRPPTPARAPRALPHRRRAAARAPPVCPRHDAAAARRCSLRAPRARRSFGEDGARPGATEGISAAPPARRSRQAAGPRSALYPPATRWPDAPDARGSRPVAARTRCSGIARRLRASSAAVDDTIRSARGGASLAPSSAAVGPGGPRPRRGSDRGESPTPPRARAPRGRGGGCRGAPVAETAGRSAGRARRGAVPRQLYGVHASPVSLHGEGRLLSGERVASSGAAASSPASQAWRATRTSASATAGALVRASRSRGRRLPRSPRRRARRSS